MSLSLNSQPNPAAAGQRRADAPRPQYIELKANVHRKLLNRLNLEALASAERARAESEIRTLLFDLIAEESMPLSMTGDGNPFVVPWSWSAASSRSRCWT